jgi:gliding motility-associated-like protein
MHCTLRILLFPVLLMLWTSIDAQSAPALTCAQVDDAGAVDLSWVSDPAGDWAGLTPFAYHVQILDASPSFGQFFQEDLAAVFTTGANLSGAVNFSTQSFCFTVTMTDDLGGETSPSDTICGMHLEVAPGLVPGTVDLDWNSPYPFDAPAGAGANFIVEQQMLDASWSQVATVLYEPGNVAVSLEVDVCADFVYYRIRLEGDAGMGGVACDHLSAPAGSFLADEVDPTPPVIATTDVDSLTGLATLSWEPSVSSDAAGYLVYLCAGGFQSLVATLEDGELSWTNAFSTAGLAPESYNVAAFDSCYVDGAPDPGAAGPMCAASLFLMVQGAECSDQALLSWSPVVHWEDGVDRYEIRATEELPDGSLAPTQLLASVPGNQFQFHHQGAHFNSVYHYRVEAFAAAAPYSQNSNAVSQDFIYPTGPTWATLTEASITSDTSAVIRIEADPTGAGTIAYELYRSDPGDDDFDYVNFAVLGGGDFTFNDGGIDARLGSYRYYVQAVNSCGDSILSTTTAHTVFLDGAAMTEQLANDLNWSPYLGWASAPIAHTLYRSEQLDGTLESLLTLDGAVFGYEDDVTDLIDTPGQFCYVIRSEFDASPAPAPGSGWTAWSNVVCLTQDPVVWVPNAIVPTGVNNMFRPVLGFSDIDSYQLVVYSRWGDILFRSTDPDYGWDGTRQGQPLPEAFYPYHITIQDGAGAIVSHTGQVLVLR